MFAGVEKLSCAAASDALGSSASPQQPIASPAKHAAMILVSVAVGAPLNRRLQGCVLWVSIV
jgi:hypothetical protein